MGLAAFNRMRRQQAERKALKETQEAQEAQEAINFDDLSYDELKDLAKERGIPFVGIKKTDLIEALKASE